MLECQISIVKTLSVCIATIMCTAKNRLHEEKPGIIDRILFYPFPADFVKKTKNPLAIKMLLTFADLRVGSQDQA